MGRVKTSFIFDSLAGFVLKRRLFPAKIPANFPVQRLKQMKMKIGLDPLLLIPFKGASLFNQPTYIRTHE